MRLARLLAGVAVALVAGVATTGVRADTPPSGWDTARDPAAADRYALHLRVREMMASAALIVPRGSALTRARSLLEQAHAEESPDVRLRLDLGEIYSALEDNIRAIEVLQPAIDADPDSPAALDAYPELANAYAKLDRSADERRVYERFLPRVTEETHRATAMLNLSEADMHLGDLDLAIAGYKATIEEAASLPNVIELELHTGALAQWGLAVALDRSGDVAGGARETKLAVQLDRDMHTIRADPHVFFSPERERNWYVGLGFAEYARQAEDARGAATLWHRAEGCWREYIDDATRADRGGRTVKDRWIDLARDRFERARAQRLAAEKRLKTRIAYPPSECLR